MRSRLPTRLLAASVAAALMLPVPALAERLPTDVVGELPVGSQPSMASKAPDIQAPAGILTTADGRVLWARSPHARRAMASTTKIMTAVVVLERAQLSDEVTVPKEAAAVAQSPVNLVPGERLSVRQLLEAMLIESANDAAYALAVHVGGSIPGFASLMNAEAAKLHLADTHYVNPHGLDEPGHFTSAADLATLARYAMAIPEFRRIVEQDAVLIPGPRGERRVFRSTDELIGSYPGMEGVKTGFTNGAGYCLVSAARRSNVEVYGVILGTRDDKARFAQTQRLLDWGFAHYHAERVIDAGRQVGVVPVSDWLDKDIVARTAEQTSAVVFDLAGAVQRRYELRPMVAAPVHAGDVLGSVTAVQGSRVLATVPLVAAGDVPAPGVWDRLRIAFVRGWRSVFGPRETRAARLTVAG